MNFITRVFFVTSLLTLFIACKKTPTILVEAEKLMYSAPDSALKILKTTQLKDYYFQSDKALYALLYCQASDKNDIKIESDSLISIATEYYDESEPEKAGYAWFYYSRIATNLGDAKNQAAYLLKAIDFSKETNNYLLIGLVLNEKGKMYKNQNQTDSSIYYYKLSHKIFKKINDKRNLILSLQSIGNQYAINKNYSEALINYKNAENLSISLNDDVITSYIYRCLGNLYLDQKKFEKAIYYFQNSPSTNIEIYNSNKCCLISNVFVQAGNFDSARYYLNKVKEINGMEKDYYGLWEKIYEKERNFEQALKYSKKTIESTDSLNKHKLDESFASIEKKYEYQKIQLVNKDLNLQNKQKSIIILLILLLLSSVTTVFLFWKNTVKNKQLSIEKELLKQESLKALKEHENTILLEKQLKLQNVLLSNIEQHRKNTLKLSNHLSENPKVNFQDKKEIFYTELITCMDIEYMNISKRLHNEFPLLTENDIHLCCLLLANFDSGTIATIMNIKIDSISKLRYRLRSKLKLKNTENLIGFLREF